MPKLVVFCVMDKAVEAFAVPFCSVARGEALRGFMDACKDPKSSISAHPGDYTLFELGTFDQDSGLFVTHEPQRLLSGLEVKSS